MTFPAPTGAQLLRALKAPALGYLWLLGGTVLTTVLIVVATNVGSTGNDTGVDSGDTSGLGVLLGMPFQIASMALFGSLHLGSKDAGISLFMPPLLLTGLFLLGTARTAARGEAVPAAGTRALLSVAVGFLAAVVMMPLTWALAMRESGVTLHAASVSLFFGSWAFTGLGVYVGASRAARAPRPSWVPSDYLSAAGLWLRSLLAWVAVAVPVLAVVAGIREAFWLTLVVPVWGATAALYTYSLGHFGALTAANQDLKVWDLNPAWTVVLIVAALALAVLTSVAWYLRRDTRPASLATGASWVVLPSVYAFGGMAVWLVSTVVVGGGIGDVSGSLTLQPAFWFLFVLAGWGLAVEVVSRFVAPSLVPALPAPLVAKLRGPERLTVTDPTRVGVAAEGGSTVYEPRPLTPEERARYKRVGIALSALVVLVVAGWVAVSVLNSRLYGPEDQARAYLDAVVHADMKDALDLAPAGGDGSGDLLTPAIYRAADSRITGYKLGDVKKDGSRVTVRVRLEGLDNGTNADLVLEKAGHTHGVFDKWRVADGGLARLVSLTTPENSDGYTVNGVAVTSVADDVWLLPGTYVINPYAGNKWLQSTGDPVVVSAEDGPQFLDLPDATASDAFVSEVQRQIDAYIAKCMAATELEPAGCPNSTYGAGSGARNVHWTLQKAPVPDFGSFDGTFPADLSYGEEGLATVSYESDESYGFGAPDWQPQTEESDLYLSSVEVTEQDGHLVVKIGGNVVTDASPSSSDAAQTEPPSDAPFAPDTEANGCVTKAEFGAAVPGTPRGEIEKAFGAPVSNDPESGTTNYVSCDLQHAALVKFTDGRLATKQWVGAS